MKGFVYGVDPGKKQSAVAVAFNGEFIGVWFAAPDSVAMAAERLGIVFMEQPRAYQGPRRENVDPNDLIDITAAGMAVAARLAVPGERVRLIEPQAWKGQVPKPITQKRIQAKLSTGERVRLGICLKEAKGQGAAHNLFDAVGILLVALKRAQRGVV